MLRRLPANTHPDLLVGFENKDDAGVFRLSDTQALVQTIDFFTPIVDDPYSYGQIAAANALSDVYAMGGRPMTVMNVACFNPSAAPAEVWAEVLRGMWEKCQEAGAVVVGGHSVEDQEPKFGLSVTGVVDPSRMFANTGARLGDQIILTKPLGTGITTTAAKFDQASEEELAGAIRVMATLNAAGAELGLAHGVRCATDVTGFGLAGHLWNIARASQVRIEIDTAQLPLLPHLERMIEAGLTTGGASKNRAFLGENLVVQGAPEWLVQVALDPQTSGGLALFLSEPPLDQTVIGRVIEGSPAIVLL